MRDSKAEFQFLDFQQPSRTPGPAEPLKNVSADASIDSSKSCAMSEAWAIVWRACLPHVLIGVVWGGYLVTKGWWL